MRLKAIRVFQNPPSKYETHLFNLSTEFCSNKFSKLQNEKSSIKSLYGIWDRIELTLLSVHIKYHYSKYSQVINTAFTLAQLNQLYLNQVKFQLVQLYSILPCVSMLCSVIRPFTWIMAPMSVISAFSDSPQIYYAYWFISLSIRIKCIR